MLRAAGVSDCELANMLCTGGECDCVGPPLSESARLLDDDVSEEAAEERRGLVGIGRLERRDALSSQLCGSVRGGRSPP